MKTIKMLNTAITLNYKSDIDDECYDTEFIVQADADTTFSQIKQLLNSFYQLKNSYAEYLDKRTIMLDKTKKEGTFVVRLSLIGAIKFDEFLCRTDDFKSFEWYARKIRMAEELEDFKPIN